MPTTDELDVRLDALTGEVRDMRTAMFGLGDDTGRIGYLEAEARGHKKHCKIHESKMEDRVRKLEDSKLIAVGWMTGAVAVSTLIAQAMLKLFGG